MRDLMKIHLPVAKTVNERLLASAVPRSVPISTRTPHNLVHSECVSEHGAHMTRALLHLGFGDRVLGSAT